MSNLKSLAQKAKNRLKSVGLNASTENVIVAGEEQIRYVAVSYLQASSEKEIEDDKLYPKIKSMLETDPDNPYPLRELVDNKVFSKLDSSEKEKYILDLSKRFNRIKEKILLNMKNL